MPEPKKDFFRKYLTRKQAFVLLNVGMIASLFISGRLDLSLRSIVSGVIVLAIINAAACYSLRYYPDWK